MKKENCIFIKNFEAKNEICDFSPETVFEYLKRHLDFELPKTLWQHISDGFSLYWNMEASVGGYYDSLYCFESIQTYLKQKKIIYSSERLQIIVNNILDYADMCNDSLENDEWRNGNEVVVLSKSLLTEARTTLLQLIGIFDRYSVVYTCLDHAKNIWLRDFMPIELSSGEYATYRYNPDYLRNFKTHQSEIVSWKDYLSSLYIKKNEELKDVIIDGGNVIRCGKYVVMTAKVFEENPEYTPAKLISLIEKTMQAELIVLPWDTKEIFGHADGILRYVGNNTVVMTNYRQFDKRMADRFVKCIQPYFKVIELNYNVERLDKRSWVYINWLETDKVLIVPKLNIPEDEQALKQIEAAFPAYRGRIEMVDVSGLVKIGGGLNCCSWIYRK